MTLEEIILIAKQQVQLEPNTMQRLLLLLADDSARLMRRIERSTGSASERRQAAHTVPIEDCHRILLRTIRLLADLRIPVPGIVSAFEDWEKLRPAESMVGAHAHRFRQALDDAIMAKIDYEADSSSPDDVHESALHLFRAAAQLSASAQGLTPKRFTEQLAVSIAA